MFMSFVPRLRCYYLVYVVLLSTRGDILLSSLLKILCFVGQFSHLFIPPKYFFLRMMVKYYFGNWKHHIPSTDQFWLSLYWKNFQFQCHHVELDLYNYFPCANRLDEKLTNLESENKVLRQQALSIAETSKALQELEAENKTLRQKVLTMAQSHKMLAANRSKSVIQVILTKRCIFMGLWNLKNHLSLFIFSFLWHWQRGETTKAAIVSQTDLVYWSSIFLPYVTGLLI